MSDASGALVLDNSAWARIVLGRLPRDVVDRWSRSVAADRVVVCDAFRLEALYSARGPGDFAELADELDAFRRAPADAETWRLAARAQAELAAEPRVSHRVKVVGLLVAASAHQCGAAVLHYDRDFDTIAQHTGLAFTSAWIVPPGTVD